MQQLTEDHLLPVDVFSIAAHLNHRYQVCWLDGSVQVRLWRSQQLCAVHTRTGAPAVLVMAVQPKGHSRRWQEALWTLREDDWEQAGRHGHPSMLSPHLSSPFLSAAQALAADLRVYVVITMPSLVETKPSLVTGISLL